MQRPDSTSPNVIVFFTDQQRWDTTGVHGNPLGLTPNFDRMAREGTHIGHSFTVQPVCGPARSCMHTGMYATSTGSFVNDIPLNPGLRTLAHHFKDAGYHTGYIGKWHLASRDPVPSEERGGYEEWLAANILEFTSDAYDTVLFDEAEEPVKLPGYRVDALADASIRFVDRHQGESFFLFLSFLEPHHQNHRDDYPAPHGYREQYDGRWIPADLAALGGNAHAQLGGYYGMVKRLDEALGRLLDALESLHLRENTIVLFTSDHGCHFKTRNAEYKRSCHEASLRVPTAFIGPGFDGGGLVDRLVSLVDLPPTLLEAAGLPASEAIEGRSILPLLGGGAVDWEDEVFVQISEDHVGRALRTRRWKYAIHAPEADPFKDAKAIHYEEQFLYDLQADPGELDNLVGLTGFRHVADDLRERLTSWILRIEGVAVEIERAHERPSGQRSPDLPPYP